MTLFEKSEKMVSLKDTSMRRNSKAYKKLQGKAEVQDDVLSR